jgi:hypothetical protein
MASKRTEGAQSQLPQAEGAHFFFFFKKSTLKK